jgi:Tol biopolymer transport system component
MARWTPDKTQILFTAPVALADAASTADGAGDPPPPLVLDQVFLMKADGSQVRQLTGPTTEDALEPLAEGEVRSNVGPDMSPDGNYVIFSSRAADGQAALMRLDMVTGEVVNLTRVSSGIAPAADLLARFAPDGKRIAFASVLESTQIFVMSADGRDVRPITNDATNDADPAWSPDGRWIVFVSHQPAANPAADEDTLMKVNVESGQTVTLARAPGQLSQPIFSPDGKTVVGIVLVAADNNVDRFAQPDLYQVSADGGLLHPVAVTLRTYEAFVDWR